MVACPPRGQGSGFGAGVGGVQVLRPGFRLLAPAGAVGGGRSSPHADSS